MYREHLIPHGFVTQVHFPPTKHSDRGLRELFMGTSERFSYKQFEILPHQGAILKDGQARSLEIFADRFILKEQPTAATISEYSQQLVPIATEIQQKLRIPVWIMQQVLVRFLVPLEEPAGPLMKSQLFNLSDESLESFGRPVLGVCMRIEFPPIPTDNTQVQLRIEPYFRDPKQLYLEVNTRFLQPVQKSEDLRERMTKADDFVKDKVIAFLKSTLTRQNP